MLVMAQPDRYWDSFCRAVGKPQWAKDPRFVNLASRRENCVELTRQIETVMATRNRDEWSVSFDEANLIWAPILELPDVIDDPTVRDLGTFSTIDHPVIGTFETLSTPFRIRGADIAVRGPAPDPGQQTTDILEEVGFSVDQVAEFAASGLFG
jgi:crotonobetainyl-CoA:carnitine CoA-transferase CaiB-like acyl-CoA transferase